VANRASASPGSALPGAAVVAAVVAAAVVAAAAAGLLVCADQRMLGAVELLRLLGRAVGILGTASRGTCATAVLRGAVHSAVIHGSEARVLGPAVVVLLQLRRGAGPKLALRMLGPEPRVDLR
jgi:hypothetical protein